MCAQTQDSQDRSESLPTSEIVDTMINEPLKPSFPESASLRSSFSSSLKPLDLYEVVERWRGGLPKVKVTKETIKVKQKSKVCGDQMTVLLKVDSTGIMFDIGIIANGCCCLSIGIAYHMVDYFQGKPLEAVEEINQIDIEDVSPDIRNRIGCVSFPMGILYEAAQTAIKARTGS